MNRQQVIGFAHHLPRQTPRLFIQHADLAPHHRLLLGALLLGTLQQIATVTISSAVSLLLVGLLLVAFVVIAPNGLLGLFDKLRQRIGAARASGGNARTGAA